MRELPLATAHTPEQKAFALYGTFVIMEQQAAELVRAADVPNSVIVAIKKADAKAKPTADALLQATSDYERIASAVHAGTDTPERLKIASDNLTRWAQLAESDINALVSAVRSTQP